jgi:hypothetical protein
MFGSISELVFPWNTFFVVSQGNHTSFCRGFGNRFYGICCNAPWESAGLLIAALYLKSHNTPKMMMIGSGSTSIFQKSPLLEISFYRHITSQEA